MKHKLQQGIGWLHVKLARKPLPKKLAIYFHELEPYQWPEFRDAISYLKDECYCSTTASEFVAAGCGAGIGAAIDGDIDGGTGIGASAASGHQKQLFISFDDNYRSWQQALPLFDDLAIKVMFYVNSGPFRDLAGERELADYFARIDFHGERVTLSTGELREIADAGHEIGCHTHSHFALPDLAPEQWDDEITGSKHRLEDITGRAVDHFSYPYGMRRFLPPAMVDYCRDNGFQSIARGIPGLQHDESDSGFMINRGNWRFGETIERNIAYLEVDGRAFERITGRSAIG